MILGGPILGNHHLGSSQFGKSLFSLIGKIMEGCETIASNREFRCSPAVFQWQPLNASPIVFLPLQNDRHSLGTSTATTSGRRSVERWFLLGGLAWLPQSFRLALTMKVWPPSLHLFTELHRPRSTGHLPF